MANILLTKKQTAMMEHLFAMAECEGEKEHPGMIAGQFFRSNEGEGYFIAQYIDHEKATALLASLNLPCVEAPSMVEVYTDIEP